MGNIVQPLKWHGGKHYLAKRIVGLMPPHIHYVEPYAGGLSVLLARDPEGVSEVVNDLDAGLTNFWRVLASPKCFEEFRRIVEAVPFSEVEWEGAGRPGFRYCGTPVVDEAVKFFVRCRQSMAGRMDSFGPLSRTRTRRGMNEQASSWLNAVGGLPAVHGRLKRVVVLCRPALDVIRQQDGPGTLFYLDPPYLHETRRTTGEYAFEMSEADHAALLGAVRTVRGRVMLSGYPSRLYDEALAGWGRRAFELPNNAAAGAEKERKTEVLWCNFGTKP